ncbi:hypothetical protein Lalb_Chr00c01g0403681 [Lupinus albus]|uniref:Uncharacterized protein n=1 Tax=Lupinus albus TaxID=3870 RepID=A0A6A4MWM2_LUPAL|nr:hypothetical protein Lalb_Chr00c01g0403681 [Lupinus albus]
MNDRSVPKELSITGRCRSNAFWASLSSIMIANRGVVRDCLVCAVRTVRSNRISSPRNTRDSSHLDSPSRLC